MMSKFMFNESLNISDRGLAYGDGIFETIAIIDGKLQHWPLHWQRLLMGAERLFLQCPDENKLLSSITLEMNKYKASDGIIKIILTRGSGGRGYLFPEQQSESLIISYHSWPQRHNNDYLNGIRAIVCETRLSKQPALAGIKHLNRLEQVLARNEFDAAEYQEGIMLSYCDSGDPLVIEGCSSNLFFVINGTLCTPKLNLNGVSGTMRQAIIDYGNKYPAFRVQEDDYTLQQLIQAKEVFFSNSIYGILPLASIKLTQTQDCSYGEKSYGEQSFYDRTMTRVLAEQFNKPLQRPYKI